MKKILFIMLSLLMILSFHNTAAAADITISGSSQFNSSLLAKYMKKHGYFYVGQTSNKNTFNVNTFAANDAEVYIHEQDGTFLRKGITDKEGNFLINVPKKEGYRVIVMFHGQEAEKIVTFPKIEGVIVNFGYFNSDVIDGWFRTALLSY